MLNSYAQPLQTKPFPYFALSEALTYQSSLDMLRWLEADAPWRLRIAEFYEQYEFSFLDADPPTDIGKIFSCEALDTLKREMEQTFAVTLADKIDITAHKLVSGQKIKVHNDFIPGQESHRILIQLNRGWSQEKGGVLMFFNSDDARDIHGAFLPAHNTSVAFEISPRSFHAVSAIASGHRYTLVLSFYRASHVE
jgi:Rps23 Pro-64 3,4-dihydroxylase Tpa1-like proline 4-hydroxylase